MSLYLEFEPTSGEVSQKNCYWGNIHSSSLSTDFILSMQDHYDYFISHPEQIVDRLSQIYGEFVFILPDRIYKKVRLVRDHVGVIPLYFSKIRPGRWAASTSLNTLMTRLTNLTLNKKYMARIYNDDYSATNETPYNEIFRCPPGHLVEIQNDTIKYERYWVIDQLNIPIQNLSYSTAVELGRTIFNQTLSARLSQNTHVGTLLSGGLDSGYITTKLSEVAERTNTLDKVAAFSLRFQNSPEEETEPIERIINKLKCRTVSIQQNSLSPEEFAYNPQQDPRQIFYDPSLWLFKPLLNRAQAMGMDIVMTGLGGDDVFQPGEDFISELSLFKNLKMIYRELTKKNIEKTLTQGFWQHFIKPSIPFFAYKTFKKLMPSELSDLQIECRKKLRSASRVLARRFLFSGMYAFGIEQEQELAQHYGLRMSYPLLDRRFIELIARLPATYLCHEYLNKPFLRSMSQNSLPFWNTKHISQQSYCAVRKQTLLLQRSRLKEVLNLSKVQITNIDSLNEKKLNSDFDLVMKDCYTALSIRNKITLGALQQDSSQGQVT